MKLKKLLAAGLIVCAVLSFGACSKESPVYVQSVKDLTGMGGIAPGDRFNGVVVSENTSEIKKDSEKTVKELLVKEGQDVKEGEALFSYDTEELQLSLDKQRLELEQLKASVENYAAQIKQLEKERASASGTAKLQYTIQIQTNQVDQKEAELNIKTKENEIKKSEDLLANATVVAPVAGRVQSINEDGGTDNNGKPLPYITIQQVGSYRVKGSLGELQRGGLMEGDRMKLISRTNPDEIWYGTVTLVDYASPIQNDRNGGYAVSMGGSDEMSTSSKYPFYVQLDSTDGLILGQHLYLEVDTGEGAAGLELSSAFIAFDEDGSAYVWAEKSGKLEKRPVTVGDLDEMKGTYQVLEGLTMEDYVAFPDPEVCKAGAPTTHELVLEDPGDGEGGMVDDGMISGGEVVDDGMISGGEAMDGVISGGEAMDDVISGGEAMDGMAGDPEGDLADGGETPEGEVPAEAEGAEPPAETREAVG